MSTVTLSYKPYVRADVTDVEESLCDARDLADDACAALKSALERLAMGDMAEAGSQLATALASLQDAVEKARACVEPVGHWADRQSGDW